MSDMGRLVCERCGYKEEGRFVANHEKGLILCDLCERKERRLRQQGGGAL